MFCENCQKRQAHVHLTQIVNGQAVEANLCEACAMELKSQGAPFAFSVHEFLKNFYTENQLMGEGENGDDLTKKCSGCQQTYETYKRSGVFGCPDCYRTFRILITPLVKRIHGQWQHTGKVPVTRERVHRFQKKKEQLQSTLKEAVRQEAFEKAAELRDQIQLLDRKINQLKEDRDE